MTDDRDPSDEPVDPEVRAWFATQATPTAPPSLHAFLEGMPAQVGRVTPVRRVTLRTRLTASSRFLAVAAVLAVILVAGGLLLVFGQRAPVGPSSSVPPLTAPSPSATLSPSPSPLPSPSPSASTIGRATASPPTATPSAASLVDSGGIFGTSGLWAARGSQLYLSTDYGASWVQRSLVPSVLPIDECGCASSIFVLDATHAWSARPGPGSTPYDGQGPPLDKLHVVVSRSSDGGKTWRSAGVPGDWGGSEPVLAFADASHGYLLLAGLRGGGASGVFATADGGATWRLMGGSSSIDRLGSIFGVTSPDTLWSGNQGDAGPVARPILDVSRDGGRTWLDARLPGLIGDIFVNDTLVAPPVITGLAGAVGVLVESPPDTSSEFRFFRTTDGGLSWVPAASITQNDSYSATVAVIDATHFMVFDPEAGVVRRTSDGGVTWAESPMSDFSGAGVVRFWDPDHGAAIVQLLDQGPDPTNGVFRTTDGGGTWLPVSFATTP
jgi:hypothetical protein